MRHNEVLVTTELDSGKLIALLQPYTRSEFEFSLYYQPRYKMPLRVREFKDYLIKRTKELKTDVFSV
ncbi:type 2 periplasmic-binding domain-containing protein [Vibrio algicola]|uniref:LysR substrate-binding domain-containing protein n=2 Tax=Vibrio TaxID=662 RepID=A0A5Q0TGS4_9VIBR|nr:hypothetical protein [Vibrio algicola]